MNLPMRLRVLYLSAEAKPLVRISGLGEAAGALPLALSLIPPIPSLRGSGKGVLDIRLVIPYHASIREDIYELKPVASFRVPHRSGSAAARAFSTTLQGLPVYLIDGEPIRPQEPVYSEDPRANGQKFVFFSLAALELARALHWQPHILHLNDWSTAIAGYALAVNRPSDGFFKFTTTLLTVHNLPNLGQGAEAALDAFGLPPAYDFHLPEWAQRLPLALGLLTADQITTVSPTYAQEILTPAFGAGLDDFLRTRQDVITGILNGIDTLRWDPTNDLHLASPYSANSLEERQANKIALQQEVGLPTEPRSPLLAIISRLNHQKGTDLALKALRLLLSTNDTPLQVIILGTGPVEMEEAARQLQSDYPSQARVVNRCDLRLSRRIFAGADAILLPARCEPCGHSQMIALRYGCVPIAHAIGGLRDTIRDYDESKVSTGFLFQKATLQALVSAIQRALQVYDDPQAWRLLQQRGMEQDFSWERSAQEYLKLYQEMAQKWPAVNSSVNCRPSWR